MMRNRTLALAVGLLSVAVFSAPAWSSDREHHDQKERILITNDDGSVSLIARDEHERGAPYKEVDHANMGWSQAHWPANQYRGNPDWWWIGLPTGYVWGFKAERHEPLVEMLQPDHQVAVNAYTYAGVPAGKPTQGENFAGVTPNGKRVWNAAREIDEIQEIDADPHSPTFGQILTHISVPLSTMAGAGSATSGKMRPCDMSITPDGKYLFEPDIGGETITSVDTRTKQVVSQLRLYPLDSSMTARVRPFMLTTNGKIAMVETLEGKGNYAVIDVSDPHHMREIKRITDADGIGARPQTNEFSPDGKYDYMITNGTPTDPGKISVLDLATLQVVNNIALPDNCQPYAGDFSRDGRHFFVACPGANVVAVIDTHAQQLVQTVAISGVNPLPRGVVVR